MNTPNLCLYASMAALLAAPITTVADDEEDELSFDEAHLFFELNNTDGDLGIHALIDGDAWKSLRIKDFDGREILKIRVRGRLRRQGLTEIFFESAEPLFAELPPAMFFERFPAGTYDIVGRTLEGDELTSERERQNAIPAPPSTTVNGMAAAIQCDDEAPGYDAPTVANVGEEVIIAWEAVTLTHSSLGYPQASPDISIHNYEVVVEAEFELADGEEFTSVLSVILPPGVTEITIPQEFLAQSDSFKYEVLAREESRNQTAIESCFLLDADG